MTTEVSPSSRILYHHLLIRDYKTYQIIPNTPDQTTDIFRLNALYISITFKTHKYTYISKDTALHAIRTKELRVSTPVIRIHSQNITGNITLGAAI